MFLLVWGERICEVMHFLITSNGEDGKLVLEIKLRIGVSVRTDMRGLCGNVVPCLFIRPSPIGGREIRERKERLSDCHAITFIVIRARYNDGECQHF